jgi:Glycosyl hydrolases family 43/F5/8 type C domain
MAHLHSAVFGLLLVVAACSSGNDAPQGGGGTNAGLGGATVSAGASSGGASSGGAGAIAGSVASAGAASAGASGVSGTPSVDGGAGAGGGLSGAGGAAAGAGTAGAGGAVVVAPAGTAWDSPSTGNPFLPGYFADPSVFYDSTSSTFYVYATTDGNWIDYSAEPSVWYSKDFVNWHQQRLSLPPGWPTKPLWAPSVMRHPTNGTYYLLYAIGNGTYAARSTSPLGPWTDATTSTPLFKKGEMFGNNDWFDAQFFVDTDAVYMTFGGGGSVGIAKLAFAADLSVSIDNSDARMTNGTTHKFKQLSGLSNYLEGSCLFKSGTRYFITYSNSACQNYNVQYAVASSPVGPFTHATGNIVKRDDTKRVLGPGHDSVLQFGNSNYLVYHRQHYPYVDVKRQVAIDRIEINGDTISSGVQTQSGVWAGTGALETLVASARAAAEPDLAYGKATAASSESDYQGGTSGNINETFAAQKGFYAARFAVDNNRGTRWAPTTLPGSLVVDLGKDSAIGRSETTFEYVLRAYHYRIEYLAQSEAADLAAAKASTAWHSYADRSTNTTALPPVVDAKSVTARYVRLTVLSADLPTAQAEIRTIIETDYANRVSVTEFKVFQSSAPPAQP